MPESQPPIPILLEGDGYIVIDKPSGVLSHAHHIDKESPILLDLLAAQLGRPVYTVHRLDRMTTGTMVLAMEKGVAGNLAAQFAGHEIEKRYLAIVRGHTPDAGEIDLPLPHRTREQESEARTIYRCHAHAVVEEPIGRHDEAWFSLVELSLMTGRTHQARRHLRRITHPVLGDKRHGDNDYNRWARIQFGNHLFLRSASLSFRRPETGSRVIVHAGLVEPWTRALESVFGAVPNGVRRRRGVEELPES